MISRRYARSLAAGLFATAAAVLAGCGGGDNKIRVHGKVNLDGQPIKVGAIQFQPTDGKSPTAGGEIKDGTYSTEVPRGKMKVSISSSKVIGKRKPFPNSPEVDVMGEAVPAQFNTNSKLEIDVSPEKTEQNFELDSTKK
ncbi:hypothetical protein [Fimbriiglobus ruber]|uniref:Carboxypeptidase regulatory-like domain-containing protein n=1 Tax=Fimbriiglobus ruber TaxID=1908690 RepID=A0A225DXD3_9BACT|nr:hypothetical protein [Fimbriiglobus ruber]OWK41869.1 hypothetical protein FRUB_03947 [Fimbriiglobus ruber]